MPAPCSIPTFHGPTGGGFTPAKLCLDRAARLSGRSLILTPGTANSIGAATHAVPVNVSGAWHTKFRFLGNGASFALGFQNSNGFSNSFAEGYSAALLGVVPGSNHTFFVRVDSGVSTYGVRVGPYTGTGHASPAYTPDGGNPGSPPDFTSGHEFTYDLAWTPSALEDEYLVPSPPVSPVAATGSARMLITDHATSQVWGGTYTDLASIPPFYRRLEHRPEGNRVYATFTSCTGSTSKPPATLRSWEWTDADGTPPAVHATATLTVSTPGIYSAGAYVGGKLRATLLDATPLDAGTYLIRSDGYDNIGVALPSSYQIKAIRSGTTTTARLLGQTPGVDPTKEYTLTGSLANHGVEVSADGTLVMAAVWDQESVGGAGRFLLDAATGVVRDEQLYLRQETRCGEDWAWMDGGSAKGLYLWTYDNRQHHIYNVNPKFVNPSISSPGFTGTVGHVNPDGSWLGLIQIEQPVNCLQFGDGPLPSYHLVPRLTALTSTFAVAVKYFHYVGEYNSTTGYQVGGKIEVPNPSAVAVLPSGNILIAHSAVQLDGEGKQVFHDWPLGSSSCPVTRLSVYTPTTHTKVGATIDLAGIGDIRKLSCRNGRLAISDDGAGQKCMKVYAVTGDTIGALLKTFGTAATAENDDGKSTLWSMSGGSIDDAGNGYVGTRPFGSSSRSQGAMTVGFNADGSYRWSNYGLGYTNVGIVGPSLEPDIAFTSMLKAFRKRPNSPEYDYIGAMAYPGGTKPDDLLMGVAAGQCSSPMTLVNLGGVDFLTIPILGRLPVFRHLGGRRIKPAASIGFRNIAGVRDYYTWSNPGDVDDPDFSAATITLANPDGNVPQAASSGFWTLAANGDAWCGDTQDFSVWKFPFAGLNGAGNPTWNPADKVRVVAPTSATYLQDQQGGGPSYLAVGPDAFYVLAGDTRYAPYSSSTYGGYSNGGLRSLHAFALDGTHLWSTPVPEFCGAIAAFSGGVAVGGYDTSRFHVYRRVDGLRDAMIRPITGTDLFDFSAGAAAANTLPGGKTIITGESIKASGYLISEVDRSAGSPAYSATLGAGQTADLVADDDPGPDPATVAFTLRAVGGGAAFSLRAIG